MVCIMRLLRHDAINSQDLFDWFDCLCWLGQDGVTSTVRHVNCEHSTLTWVKRFSTLIIYLRTLIMLLFPNLLCSIFWFEFIRTTLYKNALSKPSNRKVCFYNIYLYSDRLTNFNVNAIPFSFSNSKSMGHSQIKLTVSNLKESPR